MAKDTARRIGAISGLVIGIVLMRALDYSGIVAGAAFGAGFCVLGSIIAEQLHQWNQSRGR